MVPLLQRNIDLNHSPARAMAHHWGQGQDLPPGPFSVILMSDVVYDPVRYSPLIRSLVMLTSGSSNTVVLWAHRHRNPDDALFMAQAQRYFHITPLERTRGEGATMLDRTCQDVKLYRMERKGEEHDKGGE